MRTRLVVSGVAALAAAAVAAAQATAAETADVAKEQLKRGEYLVNYGGCGDCHTPKVMTPNGPAPDPSRLLSGHAANTPRPSALPPALIGPNPGQWGAITNNDLTEWVGPWGTSYASNLTPDVATGMGNWTSDQFITTMRTGKHLGVGRLLLPPMPWFDIAKLTDHDLRAVFAYLKSIKPIQNPVPQPVPPKGP
ncbi:MAG: diheme cytochrome c-553 [Burkholderiaceae bacterium]|nr:diheme cytochrome c-553 [Burkholderiaceae bacterium]